MATSIPALRAAGSPPFFCETYTIRDPNPRATSSVLSSDPSLTTIVSTAGCVWASALPTDCGSKCPCRKHGITTDTSGAVTPSSSHGAGVGAVTSNSH